MIFYFASKSCRYWRICCNDGDGRAQYNTNLYRSLLALDKRQLLPQLQGELMYTLFVAAEP